MSYLVIAEHDNVTLKPATRACLSAAKQLSETVTVLVAGEDCKQVANEVASIEGVTSVIFCDHAVYKQALAENLSELILSLQETASYTTLMAAATSFGKDILPRIAAKLNVAQISEITGIVSEDTFIRPVYAGNAVATVKALDTIRVITVRATAFDLAEAGNNTAPITINDTVIENTLSHFIKQEDSAEDRPELTSARVVVAGGRALQSAENFKLLDPLADCLGAAIGASRAAVDAGYVSNDYQIGQTGKVVAPELYIAIGISGAIQHLAGMKDSKVIVAINKDEDAPIFQVADYGLVADLFEAIPELDKLVS